MMRIMRMMLRMMMGMMMRMIRMTATFPERSHTSLQTQIFAWSDLKVGFPIIPLTIMTIISRQPQWKIFLIILDVKNNRSYQITKGSKFWMLPFVFIYIWQLTCYRNVSQFVGDPNQTSTYAKVCLPPPPFLSRCFRINRAVSSLSALDTVTVKQKELLFILTNNQNLPHK